MRPEANRENVSGNGWTHNKLTTMTKYFLIAVIGLICTGCYFGDNPSFEKELTKNYWLFWFDDKSDQQIIFSTTGDINGGSIIIDRTVFAIGFNDNFIIAKQHPEKGNTLYHIIETKVAGSITSNIPYRIHTFDNDSAFKAERLRLHVPDNLTFTIVDQTLQ
jgi:hypothetical protein